MKKSDKIRFDKLKELGWKQTISFEKGIQELLK